MKLNTMRKRIVADVILTMFVEGKINTQNDVDAMMLKIRSNLNMSAEQAGKFFRNAIGVNN
jgi:hypothetical protein